MSTKSISFFVFLICFIFGIVNIIIRRMKLNKLSEEEKTILKDCKNKIANQKRKGDILRNILILVFIAIVISYSIKLIFANIELESTLKDPFASIISIDHITSVFNHTIYIYSILYMLIRSITYMIFTRSIISNKDLTDKQKNLLKLCYSNRVIIYIIIAILIITLKLLLEPSGCF